VLIAQKNSTENGQSSTQESTKATQPGQQPTQGNAHEKKIPTKKRPRKNNEDSQPAKKPKKSVASQY
jgi:hypothetical protein